MDGSRGERPTRAVSSEQAAKRKKESAPRSLDRKRKQPNLTKGAHGRAIRPRDPGVRDEAAADGRGVVAVSVLRHSSRRGRVTGIGSASAPTAAI